VAEVIEHLRVLPGVRLARMSGSGATCFALFGSASETAAAAQKLSASRKDWWICPTTLGSVEKRA
jgi:4-diphosphocytidyl-2-C-methyl-D-erythritol kinase